VRYNIDMNLETICIAIASYNTLSTREEGLDSCLEGLNRSIYYFNKLHPDVRVVVSWVDDASTDNTIEYVKDSFINSDIRRRFLRLEKNSHQGYCRNLATKIVDSDYIMFCDSDDVFLEDHIKLCYDLIKTKDSAGRHLAMASTGAYFDPKLRVYPDWKPRISATIPITKIIRRDVWEFLEGFPVNDIYKQTGCEDQDFFQLVQHFFYVGFSRKETVEYKCYPGSFFETQLEKFSKHPNYMTPCKREQETANLHRIRRMYQEQRIEFFKHKLMNTDWYTKLEHVITNYT